MTDKRPGRSMSPTELKQIGERLYGKTWLRDLAQELELSPRMLYYYSTGEKPIRRVVELAIRRVAETP